MDRETRKANLKKLRLPGASGSKQRKTRQTDKSTATTNAVITKYFLTPEKQNTNLQELTNTNNTVPERAQTKEHHSIDANANSVPRSRAKRTKLDAFIFKDPSNMPSSIKKAKQSLNDEDLIVPDRKMKKAPKLSQAKAKPSKRSKAGKQTAIKTAFLRNEQLFAEIAAQHCAADQFDGDDVQLALAISKSEAENKGIPVADSHTIDDENDVGNVGGEVETIREKLKKYGFRTAERKDYNTFAAAFLPKMNNRRLKTKWRNKFTALTLRSTEIQLKKLQQNVEQLLNSQCRTKPLREQEQMPVYKFHSSMLRKSGVGHEDKRIFRNAININQPNELFFVTELFEINQLPAGHLLKDWHAIQGRDLTPNAKDRQNIERLARLKNIYQDLEEYFTTRQRLDWTSSLEVGQNTDLTANEKLHCSSFRTVKEVENEESDGRIELAENQPKIIECVSEKTEINTTTNSAYDKQIVQLLPHSKCLDVMHVSSCSSINTQATINSGQKNRSNSPDLFADSDVELDEINKAEQTVTNLKGNCDGDSSTDVLKTDITTYEIFSTDEVKKISLMELNKTDGKATFLRSSLACKDDNVIDLTGEELQFNSTTVDRLNQSKPIVEIDLFAESPVWEENSDSTDVVRNSQHIKYLPTNKEDDQQESVLEKKAEATFKLSPKVKKTQKQEEAAARRKEDEDVVLHEMVMDQTNQSFLNFEGTKQLESSFHKNTAPFETNIMKYNLSVNDSMFRELCNKYLNREIAHNEATANKLAKTDLNKSCLQIVQSPNITLQCDEGFSNITMNFDANRKRKSLSFTAKTPSKLNTNSSRTQSCNDFMSNISIDLTQNGSEVKNDDRNVAVEEDDDCLVLSDDEINYSIWQANKTLNLKTSEQNALQENNKTVDSNISSSDDDHQAFHKENIIEFPFDKENEKEFSFLDLDEREKSLIKIALGPEETVNDFEILTSKYATTETAGQEETRFDRSEFGILEPYSEPIDFASNLYSPTKVLAEASFLCSPTEKTTATVKSSRKFQDFLTHQQTKSPPTDFPDLEDFDDFGNWMSTNPLNSTNLTKNPQGIDQLLNAEINCMENEKVSAASKELASETQEVKWNNKTYTVRYTNSPKPDYTTYSEAELLKELYNYGIKPLKRKQAVKILEYIYNQTHPILRDDEEYTDLVAVDVIPLDDCEVPCTSKALRHTNQPIAKTSLDSSGKQIASKTLDLQDSCGLEILRYSNDLQAELQDEFYILQTNVTKKTAQPLLPLHIAWYNLVCSNLKLHETILMYEPIDLQEIYLFLKSIGYRYDPKDLKTFFDRRCIIFRYDLAGAAAGANTKLKNSNRHVRKSKKSKTAAATA